MKLNNSKLAIRQLDKKLQLFKPMDNAIVPSDGWIKAIRTTINMSLSQLGKRMSMTPQGVKDLENREKEGSLTLNTLIDSARALNMRCVYCFIPNDESLEKMIKNRAYEMATKIVQRTSTTMKLEDQENSQKRIKQAIKELAEELEREMSKKLWD